MNIPVNVNGVTVEIPIDDAVIEEAIVAKKKKEKKTGYERIPNGQYYHYQDTRGDVEMDGEFNHPLDQTRYQAGNYYASIEVAENNARSDKLMRQLRRFAAEHGGCLCPKSRDRVKEAYVIRYDGNLRASNVVNFWPTTWGVLFATKESCEEAIKAFRDELTWYFTEYDPMPEGWWGD